MRHYEMDDYPELASWFRARGLSVPCDEDLPDNGVIVPGVAAGFLIQTDTSAALIDFFISNPDTSSRARGEALDAIARALMGRAHQLGYKRVLCNSQLDTIVRRARALGFQELGEFKSFSKEI